MPWGRGSPLGANDLLLFPGRRLPPSPLLLCMAASPQDANRMTFLVNVAIWAHGGAVISVLERLEQLLCVREDIYTARQHSCFRALCKHLGGV